MVTKDIPQHLSNAALAYQSITNLITLAILSVLAVIFIPIYAPQISPTLAIIIITFVVYLFTFLNWILFEYTVSDTGIMIRRGVIFRSARTVNFNDIQNAEAKYGPLTAICGVKKVLAFTASPAQIQVTSTKHGITTTVRPDVDIILLKDDAEELLRMMQRGDVQQVQMVNVNQ